MEQPTGSGNKKWRKQENRVYYLSASMKLCLKPSLPLRGLRFTSNKFTLT